MARPVPSDRERPVYSISMRSRTSRGEASAGWVWPFRSKPRGYRPCRACAPNSRSEGMHAVVEGVGAALRAVAVLWVSRFV